MFKAIKEAGIDDSVIAIRYLECLERVAQGEATTLILPYDSAGVLGAVAGIASVIGAKQINHPMDPAQEKKPVKQQK
jgi:hypothetical protein